jgi:hypothetical protein
VSRVRPLVARFAVAAALALACGPAAWTTAAQAEPIQQFSFQLRDTTADGSFTAVFTSRAFDTTGAPPPPLDENTIRLPAGLQLRREFLRRDLYCDGRAMIDAVTSGKPWRQPWVTGFTRVEPILRRLARLGTRADRKLIGAARRCSRVLLGRGRAIVDARPAIPEEIPADILMYFSAPTPGTVATISVIGIPDARAGIVRRNPILRDVRALVRAGFANDPSADGRYGYKLILPTGRIEGIQISVARLEATVRGLRLRQRGGRSLFWLTRPACPASGELSFEGFYGYAPPLPDITRPFSVPCPKYG